MNFKQWNSVNSLAFGHVCLLLAVVVLFATLVLLSRVERIP